MSWALKMGVCRHCKKERQLASRGLCSQCYKQKDIRTLYPFARITKGDKGIASEKEKKILPERLWKSTSEMTEEELDELCRIKLEEENKPIWWEAAGPDNDIMREVIQDKKMTSRQKQARRKKERDYEVINRRRTGSVSRGDQVTRKGRG